MKKQYLWLFACVWSLTLAAQGTLEDYQRAKGLYQLYSNKVYNDNIQPHWIGNTHCFWYVSHTPDGVRYVLVNADKRSRTDLFNHKHLAATLSKQLESGKTNDGLIRANWLRLERLQVDENLQTIRFHYRSKQWQYDLSKRRLDYLSEVKPPHRSAEAYWGNRDWQRNGRPVVSPDGKRQAYIKEHNVFVREQGVETQLSFDGSEGEYYSAYLHWSPDGQKLACMKIRPAEQRYLYFVESSPSDQLQPRLHKTEYTKPGDALPQYCPHIFLVDEKRQLSPSNELFSQQYDLNRLSWNADSRAITFEYNQRGHQLYRVLEMSAEDASVRTLVEESSDTYVNYNRRFRYDTHDGQSMIWMSERDNWNHLYLYDRTSGKVRHQITRGEWYVREVLEVNEDKQYIEFTANGVYPNEDPYLIRYYRIGFDGENLQCLTPDEGMHRAFFSSDRLFLVDSYSKTDQPPVSVLRNADGEWLMTLETADISALEAVGWRPPETFVAKGRDGETDMWGLIYRPSNFDPQRSYPIIEYIYSGPGDQYVPKHFRVYDWNMSALAELGFIVVQLDAMTTSFRSKAFESVCYQNLKDAGLPDRIAWIKAAAAKYPYMDIDRVGIFGASAGGQEALGAVLFHPEFYKAAYSSCGCHDNRMDKIWWNEQWLGYPIGPHYADNSNVTHAHTLRRPLMLVVGELDNNVDPASTMQVVNALVKAKKNFELVVLPGEGHTMGGSYGEHKRYDFFVKHLLGVEPPSWESLGW